MLEKLYEAQKKEDYDLVICGYGYMNDDLSMGQTFALEKAQIDGKDAVLDYFIKYYPDGLLGYPWNKLYRKNIIKENHISFPKMRRLEDGIFNVAYFQNTKSICVLDEPLMKYRANSQVLLKKLPYDFYDNMKVFSKNYYSFLKKNNRDRGVYERPYVIYFLNDFVCCLENILANDWPDKSYKEHRAYIHALRREKLVRYMLRDTSVVPRYSRIVLGLFKKQHILVLTVVIRLKLWMKGHLSGIFMLLKKKMN